MSSTIIKVPPSAKKPRLKLDTYERVIVLTLIAF